MDDVYFTKDRTTAQFLYLANGFHENGNEPVIKKGQHWDGHTEVYLGFPGLIENTKWAELWRQANNSVMKTIYENRR